MKRIFSDFNLALSCALPPALDITPVASLHDFFNIVRKLHDVYFRAGLIKPQPGNMIFSPWFISHESRFFTARISQQIVGTIGLIKQNALSLPATKIFADEMKKVHSDPSRTGEICALSVDPRYRGTGILRALYVYMMFHALLQQKMKVLFIQVETRKACFYQNKFHFQRVGNSRRHPDYQNRETSLLYADLESIYHDSDNAHKSGGTTSLRALLAPQELKCLFLSFRQQNRVEPACYWNTETIKQYCALCGKAHIIKEEKNVAAIQLKLLEHWLHA